MFQVSISARNLEGEGAFGDYLYKSLERSFKHFSEIIGIHATLHKEKRQFRVEITINGDGFSLHTNEVNKKDMRFAIDKAIDKAKEQIKRHKERIMEKKRRSSYQVKP